MQTTVLALSFAGTLQQEERDALVARARAAWTVREPGEAPTQRRFANGLLLGPAGVRGDAWALTDPGRPPRRRHLPPGGSVEVLGSAVRIRTDGLGLKHVFVSAGTGWSALSTSSLVLSALGTRRLDEFAWRSLGSLGFVLGDHSMFEDVDRLPGHVLAELRDGRVSVTALADGNTDLPSGLGAIRYAVTDLLEGTDDCSLELSGGLDSRVVLAAIAPEDRPRLTAVTVGRDDDADVRVASRIAAQQRLDHVVIPPWPSDVRDDQVRQRVVLAGRRREHAADALAAASQDHVDSLAPAGPRFTGLNGEYARGFYYPGTPPSAAVSPRQVRRLVVWRMLANHRVPSGLLLGGDSDRSVDEFVTHVERSLRRTGLKLRPATDEFYLHERVVGWAGPTYSHASTVREVLAPFTHPAFLRWVGSVPPSLRAGSRALAAALARLDPTLASIELAGGTSPARMARRSPLDRSRAAGRTATKVGRKLAQKLGGSRRPPLPAGAILPAVLRSFAEDDPRPVLGRVGFLDPRWLERWDPTAQTLDATTTSFLVNLMGAVEFGDAVDVALAAAPPLT